MLTVIMRMNNRSLNLSRLLNEAAGHATSVSPDPSAASTCGSVLSHGKLCLLRTCSQVKPCATCPSVPGQSDFPHQKGAKAEGTRVSCQTTALNQKPRLSLGDQTEVALQPDAGVDSQGCALPLPSPPSLKPEIWGA